MNKFNNIMKSLIPNFNLNISGISTDSRSISPGELFIPLIGDSFDGHNFIEIALKKGAAGFVYSHGQYTEKNGFQVRDTLEIYKQIAYSYRITLKAKVIAITGSTGKTTLKEILKDIFINAGFRTHATFENENNLIGIPKTILSCPGNTEILIVELGTNHFGEIEAGTKICLPDLATIINIQAAHLEYFKDLDGVFKEKKALIDITLKNNKLALLPNWDNYFLIYKDKKNVSFLEIKEDKEIGVFMGGHRIFSFPKSNINLYYKENIALAGGIAASFNIDKKIIEASVEGMDFPRLREIRVMNKLIIDDAYNASPVSFKKSIDFTFGKNGKKALVLGRIFELGEKEEYYENELAAYIDKKGFSFVILKEPFKAKIPDNWYKVNSIQEIPVILKEHIKEFDVLLIKGSHGTQLYKLVNLLKEL